jgi:hypothetical protein
MLKLTPRVRRAGLAAVTAAAIGAGGIAGQLIKSGHQEPTVRLTPGEL